MSLATSVENFSPTTWEEYARCYDSLRILIPYMSMLRTVASHVSAGVGEKLLDASCGTGNFEQVLLESPLSHTMSIVGIDASKEMLARAYAKCAQSACVTFREANLNLPLAFEDESFTHVVSINTLYAVENPRYTLSEFHRVLKSGGRLLLVTPQECYENGEILKEHCMSNRPSSFWANAHSSPEREELLIREAIKEESIIDDMLTVARHNRAIARNGAFHFFTQEDLLSMLAEVGFSVTHSSLVYANQDIFVIANKGTVKCK